MGKHGLLLNGAITGSKGHYWLIRVDMRMLITSIALTLTACGNTGIVPMDGDTYMVSEKKAKVGFVNASEESASVYRQANEFCSQQGKEVETLDLQTVDSGAMRSASATLQFRCADTASAVEASSTEAPAADDPTNTDELYSEILKLDDLRQRGLITDEEFEQEKKELLEAN